MEALAVTVMLLTEDDTGVLEHLNDDVFDNPVQPALAAGYLRDPKNLLAVAIEEGVVVGMASAMAYGHPDKPLQLFINEVGVAANRRGRGLGTKLVTLLLERGRAMGCVEAWVATEEDNTAARALYSALQGKEDPKRAVVYTFPLSVQGSDSDASVHSQEAP